MRRKKVSKFQQKTLLDWLTAVKKIRDGKPLVRTTRGLFEPFNPELLVRSLLREMSAIEFFDSKIPPFEESDARKIAQEVERRIKKLPYVSGALIREVVNIILLEKAEVDPKFAFYRNYYARIGMPVYDYLNIIKGKGFESKENANLQPNPETIHKKLADRAAKEANTLVVLPTHVANFHLKKRIHVHDLEYFTTRPFCQNWDLRYFFLAGLIPDGSGLFTAVSGPPIYPESALLLSVKALSSAQTNYAGGQGFFNYTVFMAPYLRGLTYKSIMRLAKMLFLEMGQCFVARGGQLLFASIQMMPGVPKLFKSVPIVYKGKIGPNTYGEYEDEVRLFFKAICEVALNGDKWGKLFNFPKLEINYDREFLKPNYEDLYLLAHQVIAKNGTPYLESMLPEYRRAGTTRLGCYQCCAYNQTSSSDADEKFFEKLNFENGEHFSWGAAQVISINAPQHAYLAKGDDSKLFEELERSMRVIIDAFKEKKKWLTRQVKEGLLPIISMRIKYNDKYLPYPVDYTQLKYIIGVVGINELVQFHTGYQLHEDKSALRLGLRFVAEMIRIKEELEAEFEEFKGLLAIARTPAESAAQKMAISDLIHFRDDALKVVKGKVNSYGENMPVYYSNGSHTYVGAKLSITEKVEIESKFFPLFSGGNIFHIWLGEEYPNPESLVKLTEKIFRNTPISYMAYTKDFTICKECRANMHGLKKKCFKCGSNNVEWLSRITGYYQNVSGWNEGKKQELKERYRQLLRQ